MGRMENASVPNISPRVSVCVPAYRAAGEVPELFANLERQTFRDFELVVADDASGDDTIDALKSAKAKAAFPVTILETDQNGGPSRARNRAISAAEGEFIAFCDIDDRWAPTKLARQVAAFEDDPQLTILGTQGYIVREGREHQPLVTEPEIFALPDPGRAMFWNAFVQTSSIMVRRSEIPPGGFDESLEIAEDRDLFIKMAMTGKFGMLEEPLYSYRRIPGSQMTRKHFERRADIFTMVTRNLERFGHLLTAEERRRARGKAWYDYAEASSQPGEVRMSALFSFLRAAAHGYKPGAALSKGLQVPLAKLGLRGRI